MLRQVRNGLATYQFDILGGQAVVHAVFTRLGGASQAPYAGLNVGRSVGDDAAAVAENLARVYAAAGVSPGRVATAHQVHSNRLAVVGSEDGGRIVPNTDGLVTNTPGLALLLRFADCQPILLYDAAHHALGLAHAGWRGLAQAMARRAVETMQDTFGTNPADLLVGLGPAIGPCCYQVGDTVASAMGYALRDWQAALQPDPSGEGWRLDLPAANAQQIVAAGVPAAHVEQAGLCTSCHSDEFFSHRAEHGTTGRFAAIAYLLPRDGAGHEPPRRRSKAEPAAETPDADTLAPPGFPDLGEFLG